MIADVELFLTQLDEAVRQVDADRLHRLVAELVAHLAALASPLDEETARECLKTLCQGRHFHKMAQVIEALQRNGQFGAHVRRRLAQTCIELGDLARAMDLADEITADPDAPIDEVFEARGLKGRICKQRFIEARQAGLTERSHAELEAAILHYDLVYSQYRYVWHGINLVALLHQAQLAQMRLSKGYPDPCQLALKILQQATLFVQKAEQSEAAPDSWDLATAAEACIALAFDPPDLSERPQWQDAACMWVDRFSKSAAGAFEIQSFTRQLVQIWQMNVHDEFGKRILLPLQSRLTQLATGLDSLQIPD